MNMFRREVLQSFKNLHKTRKQVFKGDLLALNAVREKINVEFKKNRELQDKDEIVKMVKLAQDVVVELKSTVIQAVEIKPGVFEAKISEDTLKIDNTPYRDCSEQELKRKKPKGSNSKSCS